MHADVVNLLDCIAKFQFLPCSLHLAQGIDMLCLICTTQLAMRQLCTSPVLLGTSFAGQSGFVLLV